MTAAVSSDISEVANKCVSKAQQGFVEGRLIDRYILGFDGALVAPSVRMPAPGVGLLIDFMQAFPSLGHDWLLAILKAMHLPPRFVSFVRSLYKDVRSDPELRREAAARMPMTSGVRQGCPLSGSIFALAIDP